MPEIIINGPEGRIEARFQPSENKNAPLAILLHHHPKFGGSMNHPILHNLYYMFAQRGFAVLRFNFRGVGRSQGDFDHGNGELNDAAVAMDWAQSMHPNSRACWIAGYQFGSWVGMQLLMRRPEVEGFISISPPVNLFDFGFLAPCPCSGMIVNGNADKVIPEDQVNELVERLKLQKGIDIDHEKIDGANHFYEDMVDNLIDSCGKYVDKRIKKFAVER